MMINIIIFYKMRVGWIIESSYLIQEQIDRKRFSQIPLLSSPILSSLQTDWSSLKLYIYLSLSIYTDVSIYLSLYIQMYLSIYLSLYIQMYLSIYLSLYIQMYLSIYLSTYVSIYRSIYLSIFIYIHCDLSIYLSIYLSKYLWEPSFTLKLIFF